MARKRLDGRLFKKLIINGAANLKQNYQEVDSLNVFPVPDGDTGTNMKMTIEGGIVELGTEDITNICDSLTKVSRGMLMEARGNSGVILSQLFRGLSKGCVGCSFLNAITLAKAFDSSVKQAYKAVVNPVEGTILTVARKASEKMNLIANSRMDLNEFFEEYLKEARKTLQETPDLLPILKEAGVVDSGGTGYIYIIDGMYKALNGEMLSTDVEVKGTNLVKFNIPPRKDDDEFGYCTEFLLQLDPKKSNIESEQFDEQIILDDIQKLGTSIVIFKDADIVKCHVHTLTPGVVLNIAQKYGEFIKLKIENMTLQHSQLTEIEENEDEEKETKKIKKERPKETSKYSIVSVASGDKLSETFIEMGADYIVSGGQSMNPSTEDFINAFDCLNAEHIIVFPNNGNIILAAAQAAKIYHNSDIIVVPTKTISEGFAALSMVDLNEEPKEMLEDVKDVIDNVTNASVTYAIRNTIIDGVTVKKDDYIGILDGKLVSSNKRKIDTVKEVIKMSPLDEKEMITVIYGKDVSIKEASELERYIKKYYSDLEVQLVEGGQDVYSYILAIE